VQKKVSADTISKMTLESGFSSDKNIMPPTVDELIQKIRKKLNTNIKHLENKVKDVKSSKRVSSEPESMSPFEISLMRTIEQKEKFEALIATDMPKGFKLTPVLYSKITREENAKTWKEFSKKVKRPFLMFLGNNHEAELKNLGLCQHAIDKIKQGLNPVDKDGMKYDINIDHIIERSGGGDLSLTKSPDSANNSRNSFFVNHFNNFIILPLKIHLVKNTLNEAQNAAMTPHGKSQWVLMMIPENNPNFSGFVARPQDNSHPLAGLDMVEESVYDHIGQANYLISKAKQELYSIVPQTVSSQDGKYDSNLREKFNKAVANDNRKEALLHKSIAPKLTEATKQLRTMFNKVSKKDVRPDERKSFGQFMSGSKLREASNLLNNIPLKAANDFHAVVKEIDRKIAKGELKKAAESAKNTKGGYRP